MPPPCSIGTHPRRQPLDASFLNARLDGAKSYDRIAGYFSSSILEVAGEALESLEGKVRVVCNSHLSRADVEAAKAAQATMRREWCDSRPEDLGDAAKPRFKRLYDFLRSGKIEIRVLPDEVFGLIHGKAGVITLADGRRTSFLGSAKRIQGRFFASTTNSSGRTTRRRRLRGFRKSSMPFGHRPSRLVSRTLSSRISTACRVANWYGM